MENNLLTIYRTTIRFDSDYIWLKPVCDFFGISYRNLSRKVKNDPVLTNHWTKKSSTLMFSDNFKRVLVDKIGFIRVINLINANTVEPSLREQFIKYQSAVVEYLYEAAENENEAKHHYIRLKRLERLQAKIASEVKAERRFISEYLDRRYQLQIDFSLRKVSAMGTDVMENKWTKT